MFCIIIFINTLHASSSWHDALTWTSMYKLWHPYIQPRTHPHTHTHTDTHTHTHSSTTKAVMICAMSVFRSSVYKQSQLSYIKPSLLPQKSYPPDIFTRHFVVLLSISVERHLVLLLALGGRRMAPFWRLHTRFSSLSKGNLPFYHFFIFWWYFSMLRTGLCTPI